MKVKITQWQQEILDRLHTLEIETDNYTELKGMTSSEMEEYITHNVWDMAPPTPTQFDSLADELYSDFDVEKWSDPEGGHVSIEEL